MNRLRTPPPPEGPPGTLETVVIRHADPVQVSPGGGLGSYPLTFYRKRERLDSGSWVICGAGGRAELFWPGDASSVVLFDEGVVEIGEPLRDEPLVHLRSVSHARLMLTPEDRVKLTGGAILRGDPVYPSGPFVVERLRNDILRVTNQSKRPSLVTYRDAKLDLGPGDAVDLPILASGSTPRLEFESPQRFEAQGFGVEIEGDVELVEEIGAQSKIHLQASGPTRLRANGTVVRLETGEEAVFLGLDRRSRPQPTAPPRPVGGTEEEIGPNSSSRKSGNTSEEGSPTSRD